MKERPILFSAPMVRAILDGSKTQTRRIVKMPIDLIDRVRFVRAEFADKSNSDQCGAFWAMEGDIPVGPPISCKYGQPGDRLWVRETFGYVSPDEYSRPREECNIEYRADLPPGCTDRPGNWPESEAAGDPEAPRWRPSIHMPRAASRILLEIVSVRVERLNDCSEADAKAEGVQACSRRVVGLVGGCDSHLCGFRQLWGQINGAGSWDANPWVWVVEFKRVKP